MGSQKESSFPTTIFQVRTVSFREGNYSDLFFVGAFVSDGNKPVTGVQCNVSSLLSGCLGKVRCVVALGFVDSVH